MQGSLMGADVCISSFGARSGLFQALNRACQGSLGLAPLSFGKCQALNLLGSGSPVILSLPLSFHRPPFTSSPFSSLPLYPLTNAP